MKENNNSNNKRGVRTLKESVARKRFENRTNWIGRSLVGVFSIAAFACSLVAATSCEIFSFERSKDYRDGDYLPWIHFVAPFENATKANLGLFSYRILESIRPAEDNIFATDQEGQRNLFLSTSNSECTSFDGFYRDLPIQFGIANLWMISQFSAAFSIGFGALGISFCFCDCLIPYASCPFVMPSILFFLAFVLQACSFLFFLDTTFCGNPDSESDCELEKGAWYSIGAIIGYWVSSIIICRLPRQDMCYLKKSVWDV